MDIDTSKPESKQFQDVLELFATRAWGIEPAYSFASASYSEQSLLAGSTFAYVGLTTHSDTITISRDSDLDPLVLEISDEQATQTYQLPAEFAEDITYGMIDEILVIAQSDGWLPEPSDFYLPI